MSLALAMVVTIVALIAGASYYYHKWTTNIPKKWTSVSNVKQLFLYPLKSGRRREVQSMYCTNVGPMIFENNVPLRDR